MGFVDDFTRGLMMGRQLRQQREEMDLRRQGMARQDAWQEQMLKRQQEQDKRQGVLDQQGEAKGLLSLLAQTDMPRIELPPDQAGPAAPAPRQTIQIPTFSGQTLEVPAQYREDVAARERAAKDVERQDALDLFRQQKKITDESRNITVGPDSPLVKFGVAPGTVLTPEELSGYTSLTNAAEARAARAQAASDAKAQREALQQTAADAKKFTQATSLADNYRSETAYKNYSTVAPQYQIIRQAAQDASGASDLSLIYGYMKLLDPGSTVREGEFANAQNTAGIPEQIRAKYNQVISGQRLGPDQRAAFADQATKIYGNYKTVKDVVDRAYSERAKKYGIDPADVIVDYGAALAPPTAPAAASGQVGRFKVEVVP